jgi:hypothetical protein
MPAEEYPWGQDVPVRIRSPVNIRRVLGVGENCGVFISAASSVFELGVTDFWELARQAKADVASGQTRASVEALISHLRYVVGNGLDVAAASDFVAVALAREAVLTNLGHLSASSVMWSSKRCGGRACWRGSRTNRQSALRPWMDRSA